MKYIYNIKKIIYGIDDLLLHYQWSYFQATVSL